MHSDPDIEELRKFLVAVYRMTGQSEPKSLADSVLHHFDKLEDWPTGVREVARQCQVAQGQGDEKMKAWVAEIRKLLTAYIDTGSFSGSDDGGCGGCDKKCDKVDLSKKQGPASIAEAQRKQELARRGVPSDRVADEKEAPISEEEAELWDRHHKNWEASAQTSHREAVLACKQLDAACEQGIDLAVFLDLFARGDCREHERG